MAISITVKRDEWPADRALVIEIPDDDKGRTEAVWRHLERIILDDAPVDEFIAWAETCAGVDAQEVETGAWE